MRRPCGPSRRSTAPFPQPEPKNLSLLEWDHASLLVASEPSTTGSPTGRNFLRNRQSSQSSDISRMRRSIAAGDISTSIERFADSSGGLSGLDGGVIGFESQGFDINQVLWPTSQ